LGIGHSRGREKRLGCSLQPRKEKQYWLFDGSGYKCSWAHDAQPKAAVLEINTAKSRPLGGAVTEEPTTSPDSERTDPPASAPPTLSDRQLTQLLDRLPREVRQVHDEVRKTIVGQESTVDAALWALLSRGHCLVVGVPGLAKTLLVRTLARVMELTFKRVQFTPDLMPADITGTVILQEDAGGRRRFVFARGPVFTQMLLADEINRTPPKTQAALLEAMQEHTVTVSGKTYHLEEPFIVLATHNPIEQEGTYPLPEAQLDRFLFQMQIGYPSLEEERRIVERHSFTPLENLKPILTRDEILGFREAIARIPAAPNVVDYAVRLVRATRPEDPNSPDYVKRWVRWGGSPRASQNLILAGRARAGCTGRFNVACEDVAAVAPLVLRHRIIRSFHADAEGKTTDDVVQRLLQDVSREQ
jgi:MoxR-like ATPase